MLKFKDNKLKQDMIYSINKLKEYDERHLYIKIPELDLDDDGKITTFFECIKCKEEDYSQNELEELFFYDNDEEYIIDGRETMEIYLDEQESLIECTIAEFIELINQVQCSSINEDGICVSNGVAILRVSAKDLSEEYYDYIPFFEEKIKYKNTDINLIVSTSNSLYALKVYFDMAFNEYYPIILNDDLFVEISFNHDSNINLNDIHEIFNAYIFEIFIKSKLKLELYPRFYYDEGEEEPQFDIELDLNSKLFTKGMSDIINMFNQAEGHNNDRAIVEYVKVIEYIAATVIREKVTLEVQKKLSEPKAFKPNADYIKELGDIYLNNKKKFSVDSEMIKEAIKECCDIEKLSKYSPKFITQLKNLDVELAKDESDKEMLYSQANNALAKSISDTRNNLSHAKANYDKKGLECPDNQKEEFIILLRNTCIQVIKWFYNTDESIRIIKEV